MRMLHTEQGSLKILGENPALDLLNSIDIERGRRIDFLDSSASLAAWAEVSGILDGPTVKKLRRIFEERPADGEAALTEALALRGLLGLELTSPGRHNEELQGLLNHLLPQPLLTAEMALNIPEHTPHRLLLARLALFAVDLVLCIPREQVRRCNAPGCSWFFLDHSGGRRQWCLMQGCGNAAKARRHRERLRQRA